MDDTRFIMKKIYLDVSFCFAHIHIKSTYVHVSLCFNQWLFKSPIRARTPMLPLINTLVLEQVLPPRADNIFINICWSGNHPNLLQIWIKYIHYVQLMASKRGQFRLSDIWLGLTWQLSLLKFVINYLEEQFIGHVICLTIIGSYCQLSSH